ncbi:HtaA domain-containing protein [Leucobacter chromiiresistens]
MPAPATEAAPEAAPADETGAAAPATAPEPQVAEATPNAEAAADQEPAAIADAMLSWGVKSSFRNYITSPIAKGAITLLGAVTGSGPYTWTGGTGSVNHDGSDADVAFAETDGVHFQGHKKDEEYILDLSFTQPQIRVTSPTTAELYLDVDGREFVDTSTVGVTYSLDDVHFADVTLPTPTVSGSTYTWTNAAATMTEAGLDAFGGFYDASTAALDPVTFSTGAALAEPLQTTTVLEASESEIEPGGEVQFTASVSPADAIGTVQFWDGEVKLESSRSVVEGVATLNTSLLAPGTHSVSAQFLPTDQTSHHESRSTSVSVLVAKQTAIPETAKVNSARLDWGVKESFRAYIASSTAKGKVTRLGGVTGQFTWNNGSGTAMPNGSKANVGFGVKSGVHFQGHDINGTNALDLRFTNPRVEITSATGGKLYLDVKSRKFEGVEAASDQFFEAKAVAVGTIALPAPIASGKTLKWTDAQVFLTKAGVDAFGGFYPAGTALDPLTLTLGIDRNAAALRSTNVKLAASATKMVDGSAVTLNAGVSPKSLGGTVAFSYGGRAIGKTVKVSNGSASTTAKLPVGIHSVLATFTPTDSIYGHSNSNVVNITVTGRQSGGSPVTPSAGSGAAAGSLVWSVSNAFAAYTTCTNKEAFGYQHCAKGSVETNGVGAGYLFPQAVSSSWDRASQTGTVAYSGSVAFTGYGMTMYNVANPSITVTGPTSATLSTGNSTSFGSGTYQLDLASGSKSVGANGEVTWSNVPVLGSLSSGGAGGSGSQSIGLDPLTFTVGAESRVSYGATAAGSDKKQYTAAATPPATTGVTVLTDADKIKPGGRIEIEASGFDPDDEGVLIVLYSDPIVLDDEATADENGVVRWSGTLPDDVSGEHTITIQGSSNAGAVIDIVEPKAKKSAKSADVETRTLADGVAQDRVTAAGLAPAAGMALWEWWASAAGLVAIAACMTLLTIRQRRAAG